MDEKVGVSKTEAIIQDDRRADDAKKFLDSSDAITWTDVEERRVLRKIDMRILPLVSSLITVPLS